MNILVLCTGNSARSIILEAILNRMARGRWTAFSAGSHPTGSVHPGALKVLEKFNTNVTDARSKSWDEFADPNAPNMDLVITVCSNAANETCPIWPGAPMRTHWGVDDPAAVTDGSLDNAFETTFEILQLRAGIFSSLLEFPGKSMDMKAELDAIGQIGLPLARVS